MKRILAALALTTAITAPGLALARPVTLTTTLADYGGRGAYLAIYVTDPSGAYAGSLWMAGGKSKYYKHLSDWARFDAGYTLHVDAAVEDMRDSPDEIALPLTSEGAGKAVRGRRYIADFSYAF